jgi:hypothetical protein
LPGLEGLPEHVEALRYGMAEIGDYFLSHGSVIQAGVRISPVLVVGPAAGFDLQWNVLTNRYVAVPKQKSKEVTQ